MYIPRLLSSKLAETLESFPSVLVAGLRQSGKTTFLLNEINKESDYVSLDDPFDNLAIPWHHFPGWLSAKLDS